MIKRTLEISAEPAHLAVRNEQLLIQRHGETIGQAPCEDIGMLVVDQPQTTYTHHALSKLAECGAAVVICGADHLPAAMLLPLSRHSQIVKRLHAQLGATRPQQKRLWRQLVMAKVRAQAQNLDPALPAHRKLLALAGEVRSGDPSNIEAQAAKLYWQNWLTTSDLEQPDTEPFRRDANGSGLNGFLNYGYAILRAAVGRTIVAAGLLPSWGIHHHNRSNPFCLADDLMEPFRPLVDDRVREMHAQGYEVLNQPAKGTLLELLTTPMRLGDQTGPLMVMLHRLAASLVRVYEGEASELEIPEPTEWTA